MRFVGCAGDEQDEEYSRQKGQERGWKEPGVF